MEKIILPALQTERLFLRQLSPEDYLAAFEWCGNSEVNKFMIYPLYTDPLAVKDWLGTLYHKEKQLDYGFVLKETGELIGSGGLYYHADEDVWDVGYNLRSDQWKKGLTVEAMRCIIDYAKEEYGIEKIAGTFAVENYGSQRVMEKLGMSFLEDTEYTKLDGSETFKAKTYSMKL